MFSSLYVKLGIALACVLAVLGSYFWVYSMGESAERVKWELQKAQDLALALEEKAKIEKDHAIAARAAAENHERERHEIQVNLDTANSRLKRMRLSVRPCPDAPGASASTPVADGAAGTRDRTSERGVDFTEDGAQILALGADRDSCAAQVEGLQNYFRDIARKDK